MSYTKYFNLSIEDINILESALRFQRSHLVEDTENNKKTIHDINELLAKIHHQKTWYKPKDSPYISG